MLHEDSKTRSENAAVEVILMFMQHYK